MHFPNWGNMTRPTLDRGPAAMDINNPPGQTGNSNGATSARHQGLPDDVSISHLGREPDFALAREREFSSLSERMRDIEVLYGRLGQLEVQHQKEIEIIRRLEGEAVQLREQSERLSQTVFRNLATPHRTEYRFKLPRSRRWFKLARRVRQLELRQPNQWKVLYRVAKDYWLLARSPLFDRKWYLSHNEDIARSGVDPLLHYLMYGASEGRSPSADFDGQRYLQANPDVAASGTNPLAHFLRSGAHEHGGRSPLSGAPEATPPTKPIAHGGLSANRRPMLWFYLGDTLEWLRVHAQLSGVGRVSSELFFASLQFAPDVPILPCVIDYDTSQLVEVPLADQYVLLSRRLERPTRDLHRATAVGPSQARSPQPGDHVFFTGLVWTPTFTALFEQLAASGISFSVLVHDIIPIERPDLVGAAAFRSFSEWLTRTVSTASAVYVSNPLVKEKIVRWALLSGLEIKPEIVPIQFGARLIEGAPSREAILRDPQVSSVAFDRFVLSVGTIDRRKNQAFLCRLWRRLIDTLGLERTPQLVLVGRDDERLGAPDSEFADLVANRKLLVLQGLSDRRLACLYETCLFTAFPSLSEGYGLPVAESLQYGKLCLTSGIPEIQQHAGDLCWYFSPGDADGALASFVRAVTDDVAREAAESHIAHKFRRPSWADALREMTDRAQAAYLAAPGAFTHNPERPSFPGTETVEPAVALARAAAWCTDLNPEVSILIINWNAAPLTLECIRHLWAHTEGHTYEIIIADNGSAPQDVDKLCRLGPGIRLLKLGCNRFFGEANNIAAEAAQGRFLCLLNNDAFVRPGWLAPLVSAIKTDPQVGASGPMFLFPDETIQEAGAVVDAGGYPVRFGRGDKVVSPELLQPKFVDYISAATLLVPRDIFLDAGGFDLAYEPAYYEDTDLCLKIHSLGRKVLYCPTSRVVHNEGASANGDAVAERRRKVLGDLNRDKFVSRWGEFLRSRDDRALASQRRRIAQRTDFGQSAVTAEAPISPTAVVYTPYAITPGGGERYLLTLALSLLRHHRVTVVTPHPYSALRLRTIGEEFGLDLSHLHLSTEDEFLTATPPDIMVTMCNHVVPGLPGRGRLNIYHCQFPFPMNGPPGIVGEALLGSYDVVIVNSEYTRSHFHSAARALDLPEIPVQVLHPPVPQFEGDAARKKRIILSVGRFFVGGHSKRQDLLIGAFKKLADHLSVPLELHLAGSSTPDQEHTDYLASLRASAKGYPIHFHVNASLETLRELYRDAAVYWHGTGLGVPLAKEPEKAEHFGISVVEAMSAQAIPFALDAGGTQEIITSGENGFLYKTPDELTAMTRKLFTAPPSRLHEIGRAAGIRARRYSPDAFAQRFEEVLREVRERPLLYF